MRIYKILNPELIEKAKIFIQELEEKRRQKFDLIESLVPFNYKSKYGRDSNWDLLPMYIAFLPEKELKEIPNGWKESKNYKGFYEPNKRTKIGKEFFTKLDDIQGFRFTYPDDVLGLKNDFYGRFTVPMIYNAWDNSEFYYKCDDRIRLNKKDLKEVTVSYVEEMINKPE